MVKGGLMRRIARDVLGEKADRVWRRLEILGDIAIIRKPFNLTVEELKPLAERIISELPYIKSVWCAITPVSGRYRLREFIHLAGVRKSETVYKEYGCLFKIDITKVYISPALGYEHIRVARQVREGEVVVNMFAGAGLFSIIIAKHAKPRKVYSIDINPYAYHYMVENVKLNKVEDIVVPILGDAAKVIEEKLTNIASRVLMPLPELAFKYLIYAIKALNREGVIHVYEFTKAMSNENPIDKVNKIYIKAFNEMNVKAELLGARIVRSVGPRKYQVVLDYRVLKE